jgi:hypothetical protein
MWHVNQQYIVTNEICRAESMLVFIILSKRVVDLPLQAVDDEVELR